MWLSTAASEVTHGIGNTRAHVSIEDTEAGSNGPEEIKLKGVGEKKRDL